MRLPNCSRGFLNLACATLFLGTSATALTIDDFELGDHFVKATAGQTPVSTVATTSAIGGHRTIQLSNVAAPSSAQDVTLSAQLGFVGAEIEGLLSHSQDVSATGDSTVTWDGDASNAIDFDGLGGIDLTEDGSTAIRLSISQFDYPALQPVSLIVTVYDASDAAGAKRSQSTLVINSVINVVTDFDLSYGSFILPAGASGPADFTNVGAIKLEIIGDSPAFDLALTKIGTNGECDFIPDPDGVVDSCGVCGGNEGSRDECGICFGRNGSQDSCGLCPQDPEFEQQVCHDCLDEPDGEALVDECGVCDGDGTSCCEEFNLPPIQTELDSGAKAQQFVIRILAKAIDRASRDPADRALTNSARKAAFELQNRNWIISWTFPSVGEVCPATATACASVSNQSLIDEYRAHSLSLRALGRKVLKRLRTLRGGKLRRTERKFRRLIVEQHKLNMAALEFIPPVWSQCANS